MRVDLAGTTSLRTGRILIGPEAFTDPQVVKGFGPIDASRLPGTLFHEGVHVDQFTSGRIWGMTRGAAEAEAYGSTLQQADHLQLSPSVRDYYQRRHQESVTYGGGN